MDAHVAGQITELWLQGRSDHLPEETVNRAKLAAGYRESDAGQVRQESQAA